MLGDKIIEGHGKVTGTRVLPGEDYRYHKIEVSFQESGTVLGVQYMNMGTYETFERIPGQLYGKGQGVTMTADGEGAIWTGEGVGRPTGEGMAVSFRAALTFQTNSEKLARLNSIVVMVEFEQDADGNVHVVGWEWK